MSKKNQLVIEGIPYQDLYDKWKKIECLADIFVCVGFVLSIVFLCFNLPKEFVSALKCIISLGVITSWYSKIFLGPRAEFEKIGGNIDKAFETKILDRPMPEGYYTNNDLEKGINRMAANWFESCLWTKTISKKMAPIIVLKNGILFIVFVVLAVLNINSEILLTVLQLLISTVFLEKLVRHLYFCRLIHELYEKFKFLYEASSTDDMAFSAHAVYNAIKYEKIISYYNQPLNSNIYKKLSKQLNEEWKGIKTRYNVDRANQGISAS